MPKTLLAMVVVAASFWVWTIVDEFRHQRPRDGIGLLLSGLLFAGSFGVDHLGAPRWFSAIPMFAALALWFWLAWRMNVRRWRKT